MRTGHRHTTPAHRPLPLLLLAALAVLAIHLGLAGYAITDWRWSLTAIGVTAALLIGKTGLLIGLRVARGQRK
jgi:hypothetical protein